MLDRLVLVTDLAVRQPVNEELGLDARPRDDGGALGPKGALHEAYVASSLDTSA